MNVFEQIDNKTRKPENQFWAKNSGLKVRLSGLYWIGW